MIDVSKVAYNVYAVLQDGTRLNVTPAVMDLGWEEGESELSSRFSFTVANVDYNGSPLSSTIKPNTAIVVTASAGGDEQEVASGKVIEWNPQDGAAMKDFSVVCYDDLYNLQKSQDDRYIKAGTGTKSALNAIFSDWGIPAGEYKGPDKPHAKTLFKAEYLGDIITELLDDAGDMYSVLGWAFQRGVGRPEKLYKKSCRVFTACAGAAIYRREVFETIGYFDEMHFAYLEDIDVGYRAKLYGYDNVFCPEAVVYHVGSGTSGSKYNSFKVKLAARNNVYLNYKNMRTWQLLLNSPCLLAGTFVKFLFFKKMGFGKDYVSGFLEGIRTLKDCKRVPSFKGRLQREIGIQLELIAGTAVYIYEFSRRQAAKLGAKA